MASTDVQPFRIEIAQAELDDLAERLGRTRWPEELPGVGWDYGIPLDYTRELAAYWRDGYDWRANEAALNAFEQFTTTLDGTRVHFLHVRSPEPDAVPLIISHGWPGSIAEFMRIIGPLTDPRAHGGDPATAFHVVAPSIPGYAFSGPTAERGWDATRVARAFAALMARLGYRRYGAHGGDWGSAISRELGRIAPEQVFGVHVTMLFAAAPPNGMDVSQLPEAEQARAAASVQRRARFRKEGQGYSAIQSTRPQTLSYGLTDSPAGQLAWIVEKFHAWTDCTEVPEDAVDRDQLLTNVMLYWLTGTAGSAARLYYETSHAGASTNDLPSSTPTGLAVFPAEISLPIRSLAERANNIVHWSEFDRGGHFAAMEAPDLLVGDLRAFFARLRSGGQDERKV